MNKWGKTTNERTGSSGHSREPAGLAGSSVFGNTQLYFWTSCGTLLKLATFVKMCDEISSCYLNDALSEFFKDTETCLYV